MACPQNGVLIAAEPRHWEISRHLCEVTGAKRNLVAGAYRAGRAIESGSECLSMADTPGPIFLITGPPGAGKPSVAVALLRRFPYGFHLPVDDLREWVVSGIAHPIPRWTDETTRQFRLARQAAVQLARLYATAGFAVAIDDIITAEEVEQTFTQALRGSAFHRILLLPTVAVALQRNRERTNKAFDTHVLAEPVRQIHRSLSTRTLAHDEWRIIDNSDLTVEETVDRILEKS